MKRLLFTLALAAAAFTAQADEARLLRFPSTDGNQIVFSYGGDLYKAPLAGGQATRLTSHIGYEMFARFSPDSKTIAFTGEYDGNREVYLIPAQGGEPVRLTYSSTNSRDDLGDRMGPNNIVMAWSKDGKKIVYRNRTGDGFPGKLWTISPDGGMPEQIPLPEGGFCSYSPDGKKLYFTRWQSNYGPSIWMLDLESGQLGSCTQGYNPCLIPGEENAFYCVRNSSQGRSEIWKVNYVNGTESLVLSNVNHGFTNPVLSPDGRWLLVQGNAKSGISGEQNLDIFAVRTDGSNLTQLTYHPEADFCPQWGADGKRIFFISSRGNEEGWYNVWSMNFLLN